MFRFIASVNRWNVFPHIRRLSKGEGSAEDFGKYVASTMFFGGIVFVLHKYREHLFDAAMNPTPPWEAQTPTPRTYQSMVDAAVQMARPPKMKAGNIMDDLKKGAEVHYGSGKTHEVTRETFFTRFGKLNPGDTVIFNHGTENIEGWFVKYTDKDNLVVRCYVGTEDAAEENLIVLLEDVLDVTPAF